MFSAGKDYLGKATGVQHCNQTGNSAPIKQHPRRQPLAIRDDEAKEVERMVNLDITEECTSPWASPVVLVKKKDGSTRFCVDHRKLNEVTFRTPIPCPVLMILLTL